MMSLVFCILAQAACAEGPPIPPERLALVREVSEVRISPDGRSLAFITDITGALEVWSVPSGGGWPLQLSSLGEQASEIRYSPDGRGIVFASDFGGDERPDLYWVDPAGGTAWNLTSSTQAETSPRFSPDGRRLAYTADPGQPFLYQLMVMDLGTRRPSQLTREEVNVHFPVWSPDGRAIAVTRSGDDQRGDLLLVEAATGEKKVVLPPVPEGILIPEDFSPDGKSLLCRARNPAGFLQLYLLELGSGQGRFLGPGRWDVDDAVYHPVAGILFTRNEGGSSSLYRLRPPGSPERLLAPGGHIEGFDLDAPGRRLAYLWSDSRHAPDAWVLDLKTRRRTRVTQSMLGGVKSEELSRARFVSYPSFDGTLIHALLLRPRVPRLGEPPPAVLVAHGGPDWQIFDDFNPMRQALSEAGFAVLAPNFRGSTGYGKAFEDLNHKDWGGGDLQDLIAGVRFLAAKGEIDPKRVGITGGSFGGYMTLLALAKTPGEWAAGVEAYGMPDLVLDYELTKDRFGDWYRTQMGTPKTHPELFRDRSAVNFLDRIRAPLLIFQGANDTNVPKAESELVYRRLKERASPVELVVYPDEGHGFTKRKNRADYYQRTVEFFLKHMGNGSASR